MPSEPTSAREIEAVLGQEVRQVVTRDAPRDVRIAGPDERRVPVAEAAQPRVDLRPPAALRNDARELVVRRRAGVDARAVAGDDVEPQDVVVGFAGQDRVDAAGVVSDHSPERAARVGRRVRSEREPVPLGRVAQVVQHGSGLDASGAAGGVDLQDPVEVLRGVENDGHVAALPGEARPRAAAQDRRSEPSAELQGRENVFAIAGHDDSDRHLAVVGGVGRVERTAPRVEADLAADRASECLFQSAGVDVSVARQGPHKLTERTGVNAESLNGGQR